MFDLLGPKTEADLAKVEKKTKAAKVVDSKQEVKTAGKND